jgi:hypothetical protein
MARLFSSGLRLALVTTVALTVASVTAVASMSAASAAKVRSVQLESVSVDQDKLVGGDGFTGTVALNQVAPSAVAVTLSVDAERPEYATLNATEVTIPAGSTSATFSGTTTTPVETALVTISAALSDGTSTVTPFDQFFLVKTAQTDLITVTKATMSKSGKLTVTAVSDNPDAVLSATFAGQNVPGTSTDGKFRGQLQFPGPTSGIVEVRSNLEGCAARNPFSSTGSIPCHS